MSTPPTVFVALPNGPDELHATSNTAETANAYLTIVSPCEIRFGNSLYDFFAKGRSRSVSAPFNPFSRLAFIQFFTVSV